MDLPLVQYLIEKAFDVEAKDDYQETPLHKALRKCCFSFVNYLYFLKKRTKMPKARWKTNTKYYASYEFGADKSKRDIIRRLLK